MDIFDLCDPTATVSLALESSSTSLLGPVVGSICSILFGSSQYMFLTSPCMMLALLSAILALSICYLSSNPGYVGRNDAV